MARKQRPMMLCGMPLHPSWEMLINMLHVSKPTFFHFLPSSLHTNQSTLCFWLMTFAYWSMSSLLTPFEWTWFCVLHCFEDSHNNGGSSKKKILSKSIPCKTCLSFSWLSFLGVYINKLIIFFIIMLAWHELQKAPKALLFWFCVHFTSKGCQWC
jgi:hypothetical protein